MIQNKILTLNWCFIVINDVKDIIENFTTLRVNQFHDFLRLSLCRVKNHNSSLHQFENISLSIQWLCDFNKQFVNFRLMITSEVFDTLFSCIRFDILFREIDCWKSIKTSAFVCVTSIMKTRELVFFFWTTSSSFVVESYE